MPAVRAGLVYAVAVFAAGFILGSLRVVLVAPKVGAPAAVLIETPVILLASWFLAGACTRRFGIAPKLGPRALMGATAFALLQGLEAGFAIIFGRSPAEYAASFSTAEGAIGLAAQVAFALIPIVQSRR